MKRTDPLLLGDILESIEEILDAPLATRDQFDTDKFRASHLLGHLQILGEAVWRLSADIKIAYPDIPWSKALLDFIADFANWDNSTSAEYIAVARTRTVAAHDALEGANAITLPESTSIESLNDAIKDAPRPLLVDPFAGGGALPLEGLRCGADAFPLCQDSRYLDRRLSHRKEPEGPELARQAQCTHHRHQGIGSGKLPVGPAGELRDKGQRHPHHAGQV